MTAAAIDISLEALIPQSGSDDYKTQSAPSDDTEFPNNLEYNVVVVSATGAHLPELIHGFIYVPSLPNDDPCIALDSPYVPANITRIYDIPASANETLVGLAPWLNHDNCPASYLDAAAADGVKAMIFFPTTNGTAAPPSPSSTFWHLSDEDDTWKSTIPFPVLAVDGHTGNQLMQASESYNRNITRVPHSADLLKHFNSSASVRLYTTIDMASGGGISPELWVFLLLVLGIMLVLMGLTSLIMHWLQARRRGDLRRRVENGEVDLEVLGIKRLTIPKEVLDQMPLYTYGTGEPVDPREAARKASASEDEINKSTVSATISPAGATTTSPGLKTWLAASSPPITRRLSRSISHPHHPNYIPPPTRSKSFSLTQQITRLDQPTCAICLEDFLTPTTTTTPTTTSDTSEISKATPQQQHPGSTVRQLPCTHIFHPSCIDSFLLTTSSLCPLCKASALPKGYCPRVLTNAMVRRERILRRRGADAAALDAAPMGPIQRSRVLGWGVGMVDRSAVPRERPIPLRNPSSGVRLVVSRGAGAGTGDGTAAAAAGEAGVDAITEEGQGVEATTTTTSTGGAGGASVVAEKREGGAGETSALPLEAHSAVAVASETPAAAEMQETADTDPASDSAAQPPSDPVRDHSPQPTTETNTIPPSQPAPASSPPAVVPTSNARHREWARQRAAAMLGYSAPADPDVEEARTMSGWRRAVLKVWPALGR